MNEDGSYTEDEAIDAAEERLPADVLRLLLGMLEDRWMDEETTYFAPIKAILRERDLLPVELTKDERIAELERENSALRSTLYEVRRGADEIKKNASQVGAQVNTQHAKIKLLTAELREAQVALVVLANAQPQPDPEEVEYHDARD